MSWLNILGLAVGLSMDALAVSIVVGMTLPRVTPRHVFRLSFHFGLFQFLMPVIGWLAGRTIEGRIPAYDHWVAFGLLGFLGGKMVWESLAGRPRESRDDPTRGWQLMALSVATSIDALVVGLSLAFLPVSIWGPSTVIGLVAGTVTLLGIRFGHRLGRRFGRWVEAVGGLLLVAIGLRILIGHWM